MDRKPVCHGCGHEHPVMASASRGGDTRYYCHEDDHSCYADRNGAVDAIAVWDEGYGAGVEDEYADSNGYADRPGGPTPNPYRDRSKTMSKPTSETPEYIIIEGDGMLSTRGHLYRRVKWPARNHTGDESDKYVYREYVRGSLASIRALAVKLNGDQTNE